MLKLLGLTLPIAAAYTNPQVALTVFVLIVLLGSMLAVMYTVSRPQPRKRARGGAKRSVQAKTPAAKTKARSATLAQPQPMYNGWFPPPGKTLAFN